MLSCRVLEITGITTAFSYSMRRLLFPLASWTSAIWRIGVDTSRLESIAPRAYWMFTTTLQLQWARFQLMNSFGNYRYHYLLVATPQTRGD